MIRGLVGFNSYLSPLTGDHHVVNKLNGNINAEGVT